MFDYKTIRTFNCGLTNRISKCIRYIFVIFLLNFRNTFFANTNDKATNFFGHTLWHFETILKLIPNEGHKSVFSQKILHHTFHIVFIDHSEQLMSQILDRWYPTINRNITCDNQITPNLNIKQKRIHTHKWKSFEPNQARHNNSSAPWRNQFDDFYGWR